MKQIFHHALKLPILSLGLLRGSREHGIFFLVYHRVAGDLRLEIDIAPGLFSRQIRFLAATGRIISFERALSMLDSGARLENDYFVLTVDDGYQETYTNMFPLIRELRVPAMLFPSTRFLEEGIPDEYGIIPPGSVRPLTWDMIAEMVDSGLVHVGAHTHRHRDLARLPDDAIVSEIETSLELFHRRLGMTPRHFAYPRGIWDLRSEAIIRSYFDSAVHGGSTKANPGQFDRFRIPRVSIRRSDGWQFFRAKLKGLMEHEDRIYRAIRSTLSVR